jgi:CheY-like chemotaxis protein
MAKWHEVAFDGETAHVYGDPTRLDQILVNLLGNAVKYTPAGGKVRIRLAREADEAVLQVSDTGRGIEPEMLPRIFDLFAQGEQSLDRAQGGLGIGLTLVRRLVELHGGSIDASSAGVGKGSEFVVRLPLRPPPAVTVVPAPAERRESPRRILVIDDLADARESLRGLLETLGHRVEVAENGPEGVEKALTLRPDVAIVDIGLPGLDGYQVARRIRASDAGKHMMLIALTGYGRPEDRRRAFEAEFDAHLVKPLDQVDLSKLLAGVGKH